MGTQNFVRGAFVSVIAALLTAEARATIVVDDSGGADFTSLQAAIDAAADGEQILVRTGNYFASPGQARLQIIGKGLSIVAEAGAVVQTPGLELSGMPAGRWVMVRGLKLGPAQSAAPSVLVTASGGTLLAEDCWVVGRNGEPLVFLGVNTTASPAVHVEAGGSATFENCTLVGGTGAAESSNPGFFEALPGAPGALVTGGRLAVHGGTVTGGNGGIGKPKTPFFYPDGGDGVLIYGGGFAHLAGATVTGGSNGTFNQTDSDHSGNGLQIISGSSAWVRDTALAAGALVETGQPGLPLEAPPGSVTTFSAPARDLTISSPLREGQPGVLTIQGEPGDLAYVVISLGAAFQPLAPKQGLLLLDATVLLLPVPVGVITAPGGTLTVPFVTPNLNPALEGLTVPMQLAVSAGGVTTLESATLMGWLDATL